MSRLYYKVWPQEADEGPSSAQVHHFQEGSENTSKKQMIQNL